MVTVIGVLLIIMGIFLVISVLMQSSKNHRVSGSIAGGAETFFGKQKGKTMDALFNKLTTIVTIVFVILVLALCFILPTADEITIADTIEYYKSMGLDVTEDDFAITENGIELLNPEKFVVDLPTEETPVEGEEVVAEGEETPVEGEEVVAEGEETPVEGEEVVAEGEETPAEAEVQE